jgi:hypothetical protein
MLIHNIMEVQVYSENFIGLKFSPYERSLILTKIY